MFMTHWQIYHLDQHIRSIVCEHVRDNLKCHNMTDREADMKHHVCNIHYENIMSPIDSKIYVEENA